MELSPTPVAFLFKIWSTVDLGWCFAKDSRNINFVHLCSSWSIYPCHGKVYCQRERLRTAFCIKETRSTHKLHLLVAEHQLENGRVWNTPPNDNIFWDNSRQTHNYHISVWKSLKLFEALLIPCCVRMRLVMLAIFVLVAMVSLSAKSKSHCMLALYRMKMDLEWSGMIWNDLEWCGMGWDRMDGRIHTASRWWLLWMLLRLKTAISSRTFVSESAQTPCSIMFHLWFS